MYLLRLLTVLSFIVTPLGLCYAQPKQCKDQLMESQFISYHENLYVNALIAEIAYSGSVPSDSCTISVDGNSKTIDLDTQDIKIISSAQILNDDMLVIVQNGLNQLGWNYNIHKYVGEDDIAYVGCGDPTAGPSLSLYVSLEKVLRSSTNSSNPIVSWLAKVGIRLGRELLVGVEEEVGVTKLELDSAGTSDDVLTLRGTDFTRLAQVSSSLRDIVGDSCVFDVASLVVKHDHVTDSVIGHSLGGAIAQHTAKELNCGRTIDRDIMSYSYNGIGLDQTTPSLSCLHSYNVEGEFAQDIGRAIGRSQAGNVTRFIPEDNWKWRQGPIERHKLETVREGICICMNGQGKTDSEVQ